MPVIFRGRSEYNRNYKWNASYRSASFEPKLNQTESDAGLRSDQVGSAHEPRITSRKKVWHRDPQVQSCLVWWPETDSEDQASHASDAAVVTKRQENSPLIKAFKQKEREKQKKQTPEKSAKQRSQSLDGSYVYGPKKNPRRSVQKKSASKKQKQQDEKENFRTERIRKIQVSGGDKVEPKITNVIRTPVVKREVGRSSPLSKPSSRTPVESGKREKPDEKQKSTSPKKPKQMSESIPLQHKAGLHANKPSRQSRARLTEYQRNFIPPKFSAKPSPLLSALDVVHSSSHAIPPHSGLKFQKTSEYNANFAARHTPEKFQETPSKHMTSPASPSMKKKVKDIQKPFHAPPGKKNMKSEYAAQFEAGRNFQVGELRQMAENNKQKHEGTHIDPKHASQVMSPFNELWEASSDGSGNTKEPSEVEQKQDEDPVEERWSQTSQKGSDDTVTAEADEGKETEIETDSLEGGESTVTKDSVARKLAWEENDKDDSKDGESSEVAQSELEGRITTPRLNEIGGALRTHHDLTTPCKGGALLTSPLRPSPSKSETTGSYKSSNNDEDSKIFVAGSPTYDAQKLLLERPHPLVRSSPKPIPAVRTSEKRRPASAKEPLGKKGSPTKSKRPSSTSPVITRHTTSLASMRAPIRGSLKSEEFQHCGPTGQLHTAPLLSKHADEDALSVASSRNSARATQLLRRAKERKSFWKTA